MRSIRSGNCSSYVPGGGGNRPPRKKKSCKSPGVCPGGGGHGYMYKLNHAFFNNM